jgi:predicted RNA-binding protein YlqC (UPF0109 family)
MSLQPYLQKVIPDLLDHPEDLKLIELAGEKSVIIELRCHQEDVGKIIGKNGKTISAIRTLLGMAAARQGLRSMIEVVE